jgi:ABC-type multidrug transport system fused ATPase/permease subunit
VSAGSAPAPRSLRPALRRLAGYVRHSSRYYAVWVLVTLGYVAGFVAVPMLVGWCFGAVAHGLPASEVVRRVAWLAAATTARAVLRYFSRTLVFNAARQVEYELRGDIFANLQRLPQSFYFRWRTGDIMSRCVNDLSAVRPAHGRRAAQSAPDARALRVGDRRDDDRERAARAARAAAVSALHPDRAHASAARSTTGACSRRRGSPRRATSSRRRSRGSRW